MPPSCFPEICTWNPQLHDIQTTSSNAPSLPVLKLSGAELLWTSCRTWLRTSLEFTSLCSSRIMKSMALISGHWKPSIGCWCKEKYKTIEINLGLPGSQFYKLYHSPLSMSFTSIGPMSYPRHISHNWFHQLSRTHHVTPGLGL